MSRRTCILGAFIIWIVAIFTMSGEGRQAGRQGKSERENADVEKLLNESDCHSCHAIDRKSVGPAFRDVAARYAADGNASAALALHIRAGSAGKWGDVAMPAQTQLSAADAATLAGWIAAGAVAQ